MAFRRFRPAPCYRVRAQFGQ